MGVIINTPSKGSKARLIATAPANQTYATQCATLYTAYQTLSYEEKLRSIIIRSDRHITYPIDIETGTYARQAANATALFGDTMNLSTSHFYTNNGTTTSDISSSNNTTTMKLYVLD